MQWRKLFDLNPLYAIFCDKLAVRDYVAERVGAQMLVPVLWAGEDPDAVPLETLQRPYVIKSSHGCGHTIVVTADVQLDVAQARDTMRQWLGGCYGRAEDEAGYWHVPRRIMVERCLLDRDGKRPDEFRLFVFDGVVRYRLGIRPLEGKPPGM